MGRVSLFVQLAVAAALASPAGAEEAGPSQPVPGWYNYQTRVFTPAAQPPPATAAKIRVSGTLTINATVALDAIPAGQTVFAFPLAYLNDAKFNNQVNAGQLTVTRSGNTGTISVTFSYNFTALQASETVTVQVSFSTQQPPSFPFAEITKTIPLPAGGATTVVTLPAAL